jgi:hypothetical protein
MLRTGPGQGQNMGFYKNFLVGDINDCAGGAGAAGGKSGTNTKS